MDMWPEAIFQFMMESRFMVEMGQVGLFGANPANQIDGFVEGEMGKVMLWAQRIQDQDLQSFKFFNLLFRYGLGVSDVGKIANPVSQNGQFSMQHGNGRDFQSINEERTVANLVHVESGHAGIGVFAEAIVKTMMEVGIDVCLKVDRHFVHPAEWAKVVESAHVVVMAMCYEDGINVGDVVGKSLRPKNPERGQ